MWGQHHKLTQAQQQTGPIPQAQSQQPPAQPNQQPGQHGQIIHKMVIPGASASNEQWGSNAQLNNQPKDLQISQSKLSGWEEPSPPTQRRNIPNFDDGTSLWGQQQQNQQPQSQQANQPQPPVPIQQNRGGISAAGPHWKDIPDLSRNLIRNTVDPGKRASGDQSTPLLRSPNQTVFGTGRTSSWEENTGAHTVNWDDKNAGNSNIGANVNSGNVAAGAWGDNQSGTIWSGQQQKNKQLMASGNANMPNQGWPESTDLTDWGHQTKLPQNKLNPAPEIIRNSKPYRMAFEMGFKKEDIELALRATNLNMEEALELLNQSRSASGMDAWRRHDDHNAATNFDHNNFPQRYPTSVQPGMPFPPNNNPNLINNIGGVSGANANPCLTGIGNMQPLHAQKYMNQGAHNSGGANANLAAGFNQGISGINQTLAAGANAANASTTNNQPSTQQLRMLVQQIQMAVQAGYLNHQILNQPLAPTTLVLLNSLLANIKVSFVPFSPGSPL